MLSTKVPLHVGIGWLASYKAASVATELR